MKEGAGDRPPLRLASLARRRHPLAVDLYLGQGAAGSRAVVVRLLGGDPGANREAVSAEEIKAMVRDSDALDQAESRVLADVFDASERTVVEVMQPRHQVHFLDGQQSVAESREAIRDSGFSRYPVTGEDVDARGEVGRDHRGAGRQRLDQHQTQPFAGDVRGDEHVGRGEQAGPLDVGDPAERGAAGRRPAARPPGALPGDQPLQLRVAGAGRG